MVYVYRKYIYIRFTKEISTLLNNFCVLRDCLYCTNNDGLLFGVGENFIRDIYVRISLANRRGITKLRLSFLNKILNTYYYSLIFHPLLLSIYIYSYTECLLIEKDFISYINYNFLENAFNKLSRKFGLFKEFSI